MTDVAIPLISRDLDVFDAEAGWIVTGYALIFAKSLPMYGRISDFFSLRRTFSLALVVFAAGSLICALAPSFPRLALLDANGPTGTFSNASGPLPWWPCLERVFEGIRAATLQAEVGIRKFREPVATSISARRVRPRQSPMVG